jgi:hypothetical protein
MISGLKWVNAGAAVGLVVLVYTTHKKIWKLDMAGREPGRVVSCGAKLEKPYVAAEECTY